MKIAFIDTIGLNYVGNTLDKKGLGGSESAVIYMAQELFNLGHDVTVFNNCDGVDTAPGVYSGVAYRPHSHTKTWSEPFDIVVVSRTVQPLIEANNAVVNAAKKRVLWLHDTFIGGDELVERLVNMKRIDHVFTLSDWHTSYIITCNHGTPRHFEQFRDVIFQTRNGVRKYRDTDVKQKDPNLFVYNASATKGMVPLVTRIWPRLKQHLPDARLVIVGGFYRFEGGEPDAQEQQVREFMTSDDLKKMDVSFTGVIRQSEIADLYAQAYMTLYPCAFPETFGISTLESLLYKTPVATCRFGAMGETAIDLACYKIDYPMEPTHIHNHELLAGQDDRFVAMVLKAVNDPYLHQQKQQYCSVVDDISGWDTVALEWDQFFHKTLKQTYPLGRYRKVTRISHAVQRVFGRLAKSDDYVSFGPQREIVIVAPVYNAKDYIEGHIRSVAAQDYDNYRHIIIDDCSTDGTFEIASATITSLSQEIGAKFILVKNATRRGAAYNQMLATTMYGKDGTIVMFLDGDDKLYPNNSIFHLYNDLYSQGFKFTYGSTWSEADNIPLVAQDYPEVVKKTKSYRAYKFAWGIPYTHIRTLAGDVAQTLDWSVVRDPSGAYMMAGADNPLFYAMIESVDPHEIKAVKEIVHIYNDVNPLNDYKVNAEEQSRNAGSSYQ